MNRRLLATTVLLAALGTVISLAAMTPAGQGQAPAKQGPVTATSLVLIHRHPPSLLRDPPTVTDKEEFDRFRRHQALLVKSRLVLHKALRDPKVAKLEIIKRQADPIAWLEKNLIVDFLHPEDGTIMRISLSGQPAEEIAAIVNQVTAAYHSECANRHREATTERLEKLRMIHAALEANLSQKRNVLTTLEGVQDKEFKPGVLPDTDLKRELLRLKLAQAAAKVRLEHQANKEAATVLKEELAVLAAQEKVVREDLTTLDRQFKMQPALDGLRDEIKEATNFMRSLANTIRVLEVELDAPGRVVPLEDAIVEPAAAEASKKPR